MNGLFNLENGFFQGMSKIFDVMFVSVLWVLCCMPVITIGPATVALYYVTAKVIRKERGYVAREFFKCFKQNFLSGIIYTAILLVIGYIFYFNFRFINLKNTQTNMALFYIYWMLMFVIASTVVYLFPLLSRFGLKRFQLVKMALLVSMKHLPKTLIILLLVAVTGLFIWYMPVLTCFMPGVCALLCSFPLEKVMKKYLPAPDESIPEDEREWYYTF